MYLTLCVIIGHVGRGADGPGTGQRYARRSPAQGGGVWITAPQSARSARSEQHDGRHGDLPRAQQDRRLRDGRSLGREDVRVDAVEPGAGGGEDSSSGE